MSKLKSMRCNLSSVFGLIALSIFVLITSSLWSASTYSFTNVSNRGSHPEDLQYANDKITVDLSSISQSAEVYRAILVPNRRGNNFNYKWNGNEKDSVQIAPASRPDEDLQVRGPRYITLDATDAVRQAVVQGQGSLELKVKSFPYLGSSGWHAEYTDETTDDVVLRLDVSTDQPPESTIKQVGDIEVRHESGSTMITWTDPEPLAASNELTFTEFQELKSQDENPQEIRYRIYRHSEPITSESIGQSELIGQTDALSVWDWLYFGHKHRPQKHASDDEIVPRYPVDDGVLADYDMGMYVHHVQEQTEKAFYAVSRVIDGVEDLSRLIPGENTSAQGVKEAPGSGMVLLQTQREEKKWKYVDGISTLNYYVKWEAPPRFNKPEPFNYLVAIPKNVADSPPLSIALHNWGGWINGGWLWAYNLEQYGAIHISTNQHPYDWWTGFHENLSTLKPLSNEAGSVQPFTQRRIRSFAEDFVIPKWNVDPERILLHGASMGGSGTSLWGMKTDDYFANLTSKVGVHIPAESPQFKSSFDGVYGAIDQELKWGGTGMSAWDYQDNAQWLKRNITKETPHISFCNGKNDSGIGWTQAWKFVQALIETKRPFTFNWGMKGHGERPHHMGSDIDFQLHQSVPAFTGGSLDDDIGSSPEQGDNEGQINYHYLWETDSIVDDSDKWEMSIYLRDKAPVAQATVNLTPRRLQQFPVQAGAAYDWTNTQNGEVIQQGTVTADEHGLVTLRSVQISKDRNRIFLRASSKNLDSDETPPSQVTDLRGIDQSQETMTLAWTAPGGDGDTGTAASYDIRYSTSPLHAENWEEAKRFRSSHLPQEAGNRQVVTIAGLDFDQKYYFGLVAFDDAGNRSELSNVAQASTLDTKTRVSVSSASELYDAVANVQSFTTIELADGVYPVDKELRIGGTGGEPLKHVTLKGKSGDRAAVVLQGNGMNNSADPNILLKIRNAVDCTVQDMTIRDAYYHHIQVKGEQGAQSPKLKNLLLIDAGQQFFKITHADGGVIEDATFEFTDHAKYWQNKPGGSYYYTSAVDILWGENWVIRDNIFKRIRAPQNDPDLPSGITKPAIEVWRGSKNTVVERNKFIDCDRGIFFGNTVGEDIDHDGGVIKNNMIYRNPDQKGDTGIALNKTRDVKVYHNTVILNDTFGWNIEFRRFANGKDEPADEVKNNITDGRIRKRDFGRSVVENNLTDASLTWFKDPDQADLHLVQSAEQAIDAALELEGVQVDFDQEVRPKGKADIGADEYNSCAPNL